MVNKTDIPFNIYSDLKINIKCSLSMKIKSLYRVQLASHFSFVAINADLTAANEFYQRCVSGASKTDVCYCTIKSAFMVANEKREATCSYSHSKAISIHLILLRNIILQGYYYDVTLIAYKF